MNNSKMLENYNKNGFAVIRNFYSKDKIIKVKKNILKLTEKKRGKLFFFEKNKKILRRIENIASFSKDAEKIINDDVPMSIRMDVISSLVTPNAMKIALNEGLEKSTGNNTSSITKEINQLNSSLNSEVKAGDFYEFIYLPNSGTHVLKNSESIDVIPGIKFKKAFFGIFLSNNPIQKNMKKAMLGG